MIAITQAMHIHIHHHTHSLILLEACIHNLQVEKVLNHTFTSKHLTSSMREESIESYIYKQEFNLKHESYDKRNEEEERE